MPRRCSRSACSPSTSMARSSALTSCLRDRTVAAVRGAVERGVSVSLVTGRMTTSARDFADVFGLVEPIVGMQGAVIREMPRPGRGARADCCSTRRSRPTSRGRRCSGRVTSGLRPAPQPPRAAGDPRRRSAGRRLLGVPRRPRRPRARPARLDPEARHEGHRGRRRTAPRRRARPGTPAVRRPCPAHGQPPALPGVRGARRDEGPGPALAGPPGRRSAVAGHGDRRPVRRPGDARGSWPRRGDGRRSRSPCRPPRATSRHRWRTRAPHG